MKKIIYFFIISFLILSKSFAEINITEFNQDIKFTKDGREVSINIKAEIGLENRNYFYREWSYIFDKRLKIKILEAKVIGREYKTTFGNNELKFDFNRAFNGDRLEFQFKFIETNDNKAIYTRYEQISLPAFAKGAKGDLSITVPDNLEIYSLNPLFAQNANVYNWSGVVPEGGFTDFFYLTLKNAKWKVNLTTEINSDERISKIDVKIPLYLKNGNNLIDKYSINTNQLFSAVEIKEKGDDIDINFDNLNTKTIKINLEAIIRNDFSNKIWIMLDPNKYLDIDNITGRELTNVIFKIRQETTANEQFYITLAKWVHNYIAYDMNYYGKDMDSLTILKEKKGICSHYAILYNDLLRTAGIPSVLISGVSYNIEENKFENHAWNLVYANGDWVSMDPTWGLYSGKVPVSHIFFYYTDRPVVNYTIYNTASNNFNSNIKKDIKFIE